MPESQLVMWLSARGRESRRAMWMCYRKSWHYWMTVMTKGGVASRDDYPRLRHAAWQSFSLHFPYSHGSLAIITHQMSYPVHM